MSKQEELVKVLSDLKKHRTTNQLEYYEPYPYQLAFHHAESDETVSAPFREKETIEKLAVQRALMAANQVGKTYSAAMETAFHSTGLYPDWWKGHRFNKPVSCVVSGKRNETTRDVCQNELLGDPFEETALGTGTIPKGLIGKTTRKAGVPNALTAVMVRHISGGWSKIRFMAFEQGPEAFMGVKFDVGWLDEEPPLPIWTQIIRGTLSRKQYCLYMTFTPEEGVTEVVDSFMNDLKQGQALIRATWSDADHMTPEKQEEYLKQLPPHEREMRSKGIPLMGSGLIYPIPDEQIMVDPFELPAHWPRICAVDFGIDHPFACVWIAYDHDSDTAYVYACYKASGQLPPVHASAIKAKGEWIPVMWPHDGIKRDPGSGKQLKDMYLQEGVNMFHEKFTNPPEPGMEEGTGGISIEAGVYAIYNAMETGGFKVFSNLSEWFEEKHQYHRKTVNGKSVIVDRKDDLMAATRYAYQSLRHAITKPVRRVRRTVQTGLSNW